MNKFIPKNFKHIKLQKRLKFKTSKEKKHITLKRGVVGLKILESGQISSDVLESIRRSISRRIKKIGKIFIFIHPNVPLSKKPVGVRMGKGAGSFTSWISPVKKGKIIIELDNIPISLGTIVLKTAAFKLPMLTKIVYK